MILSTMIAGKWMSIGSHGASGNNHFPIRSISDQQSSKFELFGSKILKWSRKKLVDAAAVQDHILRSAYILEYEEAKYGRYSVDVSIDSNHSPRGGTGI